MTKVEKMYATCLNSKNTDLEESKEYRIVEVKSFDGFGDKVFFVLDNGLAYAYVHFSVTYTK